MPLSWVHMSLPWEPLLNVLEVMGEQQQERSECRPTGAHVRGPNLALAS